MTISADVSIIIIAALSLLGTQVHELGHLGAALLAGSKPLILTLGHGRKKVVFSMGDFSLQVGRKYGGGSMLSVARVCDGFRVKQFIITAGGPVASLALLAVMTRVFFLMPDGPGFPHAVGLWFLLMQTYRIGRMLYPATFQVDGTQRENDGLRLWRILKMDAKQVEERFSTQRVIFARLRVTQGRNDEAEEIIRSLPAGQRGKYLAKASMIGILITKNRMAEARAEMEDMLNNVEATGKSRVEILDLLACLPIYKELPSMLDEALGYIGQALAEAPGMITLKATKAALLIDKGALDEGLGLAEEVLSTTKAQNDRELCKYYLALAHHRKGDQEKAQKWLRAARKENPEHPVSGRVEAEIAEMTSRNGVSPGGALPNRVW